MKNRGCFNLCPSSKENSSGDFRAPGINDSEQRNGSTRALLGLQLNPRSRMFCGASAYSILLAKPFFKKTHDPFSLLFSCKFLETNGDLFGCRENCSGPSPEDSIKRLEGKHGRERINSVQLENRWRTYGTFAMSLKTLKRNERGLPLRYTRYLQFALIDRTMFSLFALFSSRSSVECRAAALDAKLFLKSRLARWTFPLPPRYKRTSS